MRAWRERITIQRPSVTRDGDGDPVTSWPTVAVDVPADWRPGPGREFLAAEAVRAETAGRFVIRWLDGVDATCRVLWNGRRYQLTAPPLDDGRHRDLELMVAAGVQHDGD